MARPYTTAKANYSAESKAAGREAALPFVAEAELVLDHLERGRALAELQRGEERISVVALVDAAVRSWRARFPKNDVKHDWCGKTGIWRHAEGKDSHYDCLFCLTSIATLGRGTVGKLASKFVEKLDDHVRRCALIWIVSEADVDRFEFIEDAGRGRAVATTPSEYVENYQPAEGVE